MNKIRCLFLYKAYPFAIASYFRRALERRNDVELFICGEFFGQWIPWNGGMEVSMKYPNLIDFPIPRGVSEISWKFIKSRLPWMPNLVLNVDAGFHLSTKPDIPYYVVATDPHVLGDWYRKVRPISDKFFNMQGDPYIQDGDIWLPYAFDPYCHFPTGKRAYKNESGYSEEYDCSIIGLHYPQRDEWVTRLRAHGIKVNYRIGDIYDEYREENNKAWIGLNWSSLEDVTARVFEIMAMRMVPILNRIPGLSALGFEEGRHYLGFSSMDEAVKKVLWAKNNKELAQQIATNAYQFVHWNQMTYDNRVKQILEEYEKAHYL